MTPDEDRITRRHDASNRREVDQDMEVDALLRRLHEAINARDIDAAVACYAPNARFTDNLEGGEVAGLDGVRAHFEHLMEAVRLELTVIGYVIQPDHRVRAQVHVVTRGPGGGLWQDDTITVWYRLERGLIVEQDVDVGGCDGNAP